MYKYHLEKYHWVGTPNASIVIANTHSTHYNLSWPCCMCLSVFLAACSVWGVIWKGSVLWKGQGQIVPMMGQGRKWKCRNMMTNTMFGFASVTSVWQYVACSELPASERMEISALSQYLKTRHLTVNKKKISRFFSLGGSTRFDYLNWHCQHKCPLGIFFGVSMCCIRVRYVPFHKFILSCTIE